MLRGQGHRLTPPTAASAENRLAITNSKTLNVSDFLEDANRVYDGMA